MISDLPEVGIRARRRVAWRLLPFVFLLYIVNYIDRVRCLKFGQTYANDLRRKSPRPGDRWHLDEVFLKINGRLHYLWLAVNQDGDVLDIMVQSRRDKKAAKRFFRKLLKELRNVPRVIITDKLKSYGVAKAEMLPGVEHCQAKYQNNRVENSHRQPG
jgi:putative transposase